MNYISVVVLFVCCAVIATHSVSRMQKYALLVCISLAACFSIASIDEGFIVFDDRYHFEGCNRCAEALFPVLKNLNIDCDIRTEDETVTALLDGAVSSWNG